MIVFDIYKQNFITEFQMFKHIQINKYYYLLLINKKMGDELRLSYTKI